MRKALSSLVIATTLCWSGAAFAQTSDQALIEYAEYKLMLSDAEEGDADAQYDLGMMYIDGRGVAQDSAEAVKLYRMSAEQGYVVAQNMLGALYQDGIRVAQDYAEAAKWYRRAAEQGHGPSQYSLGEMYKNELGVTQDFVTVHMWFNIAAASGELDAARARDSLAKEMTSADVSRAHSLARRWIKKYQRQ